MNYRSGQLAVLWGLTLGATAVPASATTVLTSAEAIADFTVTTVGTGLSAPTDVAVVPDGRVVIAQRAGKVTIVNTDATQLEQTITVNSSASEQGLLGVVADPQFETNHYLYFYASIGTDTVNRHQVLRYTLAANNTLGSVKTIVDMGLRGPANLNGGGLEFYNGALYISVGDTGANATPPTNKFGTCLNVTAGKILRVNPSTGAALADNPLVSETMVTSCTSTSSPFGTAAPDTRIFAWGLRNPFRFWVDPQSGKLWIGDPGESSKEEISIGQASGGQHFGWPFFEGTTAYNQSFKPVNDCLGIVPATPCVAPAYTYDTSGGAAVIGGRILDGCMWPAAWTSRYIFGDFIDNKVWTLEANAARDGFLAGAAKEFATVSGLASIRMGLDNSLYFVEHSGVGGNKVSKVTAKGAPTDLGCTRIPNGKSCGGPQDVCESGFCVNDICCDDECTGQCMSCTGADTGDADGVCAAVLADKDPYNDCEPDQNYPQSCEQDGFCNGDGGCRAHAKAGTECANEAGQTSCEDGQVSGKICDGAGMCSANGTAECAPYGCAGQACATSCSDDSACATGVGYCATGTCTEKKADGASCDEARECQSDFCVDGVCCDDACDGQCSFCNDPAGPGACTAIEGVPRGGREACDGDPEVCGGVCDGKEGARCTYSSTTVCASSCSDATEVISTCDGKGECGEGMASSCGNYQCGDSACLTSCTSDDQCGMGFDCTDKGKCAPSPSRCISETESQNNDDMVTDCQPYTCDTSTGACLKICITSLDCGVGFVCNAKTSKCQKGGPSSDDAGCGCRSGASSSGSGHTWALLALALVGLQRRKRAKRVQGA